MTRFLAVAGAIVLLVAIASPVAAQLQLTTIDGVVTTPDDRPAAGAAVTLLDRLGNTVRVAVSSADGKFRIVGVPPGSYSMRADASPFRAEVRDLQVGAALPVTLNLRMSAVAAEQVLVRPSALAESGSTSTRVTLGGETLRDAAPRMRTRGLQDVLATVPGWGSEDNGLLHVRGVDEGVLYVVDGVPWYERFDGLFGVAPDPMTLESRFEVQTTAGSSFQFAMGAVTPGTYLLVAGTDRDIDGFIGDPGELFGAWPSLDAPQVVTITAGNNVTGRDFAMEELATMMSVGQQAPGRMVIARLP